MPTLVFLDENAKLNSKEKDGMDVTFSAWLEELDNTLACERLRDKPDLLGVANKYMDSQETAYGCADFSLLNSLLDKGVGTPKYWFHRLDYYLWKEWQSQEKPDIDGMNARELGEKIEKFQFRHNRSVEHIFPQSLGRDNEDWKEQVDRFGNLTLISISSNSSYSDQEVRVKKADFVHRTKKYGIESLKQLAIYSNLDSWISDQGENHRMEMLELLKNSFSRKKQAI